MSSRFIHIVACVRTFFLRLHNIPRMCLFIHSSVIGYLGCYFLAIINNAAMNISVQISLKEYPFKYFGYVHRSGIVESYSSRKTSISALLTMPKPLTVWITINCGKF